MTYPNGRILHLGYNSGIDASISRLSYLADDDGSGGVGTHLEDYTYLGLQTVVKRAHAESGIDLSYIKRSGESDGDAGDKYTGLGRFGRVIDHRWMNGSGTAADRFQYEYGRDGSPISKDNLLDGDYSESYGYDNIGRLIDANRDGSDLQSWTLDALGNWDSFTNGGTTQTQTQNAQNQITCISGQTTPTYDNNGSMTGDEAGTTYTYDAWGRLVKANKSGTCESFAYDAAGRRINESLSGTTTDLYYSAQWQVLEERIGGTTKAQYVWSPVYVDAMVLRDADTTAGGNLGKSGSGLDQRLYVQQDAFWNVTALVNTSGAVVERFVYDPYGSVTYLCADWSGRGSSAYSWKYLYQGGRLDGFTGNYVFRFRDYRPSLGTWTEQDPAGYVEGANLYQARLGAPIGNLDPMGLYRCDGYEYADGTTQEPENIIGYCDEDGEWHLYADEQHTGSVSATGSADGDDWLDGLDEPSDASCKYFSISFRIYPATAAQPASLDRLFSAATTTEGVMAGATILASIAKAIIVPEEKWFEILTALTEKIGEGVAHVMVDAIKDAYGAHIGNTIGWEVEYTVSLWNDDTSRAKAWKYVRKLPGDGSVENWYADFADAVNAANIAYPKIKDVFEKTGRLEY